MYRYIIYAIYVLYLHFLEEKNLLHKQKVLFFIYTSQNLDVSHTQMTRERTRTCMAGELWILLLTKHFENLPKIICHFPIICNIKWYLRWRNNQMTIFNIPYFWKIFLDFFFEIFFGRIFRCRNFDPPRT